MSCLRITSLILVSMLACSAIAQSNQPSVWLGRSCTLDTTEKNKLVLPRVTSDKMVCIDRGAPQLEYEANSLRVISYKWGGAGLLLTCKSESVGRDFYKSSLMKQAAFVVGGKVLGLFMVAEPNMGCGWQQVSDLTEATQRCTAIANAWGMSPVGCSTPCGPPLLSSGGVCVSAK